MARLFILTLLASLLFVAGAIDPVQAQQARVSGNCSFGGTYRINVTESDKLYSVVKGATSTVPFGEQQQFFIDLTTRLTPPDIVAIECNGSRVSIGSSRAARVTYLADGRTRRERGTSGNFVNSRVEMNTDSLTFVANGNAADNVNVAFRSVDGGDRLQVTRRIYAVQLPEPIIITTVYDRVGDRVDWADFTETSVARRGRTDEATPRPPVVSKPSSRGDDAWVSDLREALDEWIAATNRRDIAAQMRFYVPVLRAYYLSRNTPQAAVRAEKSRVFSGVRSVDIRAGEPEIVFQDSGRTAIMRFIKEYKIADRSRTKSGVVVQELRWERSGNDWRIFSERDIRVIR
jgi:hypothetical protein